MHVKFGASSYLMVLEIYSSEAVRFHIFDRFLYFDKCLPEVVSDSDVISGRADQDVGVDACANFGDSRLKPSEAPFLALFFERR